MQATLPILLLMNLLGSCNGAIAIVDVDSPWGGTKQFDSSYGQTMIPGFDGMLVGLRLYVTSSSPFTVTVWDFDLGGGKLGNILGSQSSTPASKSFSGGYGWAEVAFGNPIQQFGGKALAFTVTSSNGLAPGSAISDRSVYSGGTFFEYSGTPSVIPTSRDLTFQTLVVPIPEPAMPWLVASATVFSCLVRSRVL